MYGSEAYKVTAVSQMESGSYSKCGSRFSAAQIRVKHSQESHGVRAGRFQTVALALAPCAFVLNICKGLTG
eukprot:9109974-Pyramimonas_sp.AAC.1